MLSTLLAAFTLSAAAAANPLEVKVQSIEGEETKLAASKAKLYLVVNTASRCGYTRQYKGLEALYQKYQKRGLVVAGFPCNQFGGQEPGSDEEIQNFCRERFSVTFPMFAKIEVNGASRHPLYQAIAAQGEAYAKPIEWNFTKFLIDAEGKVVARFASADAPDSEKVIEAIEAGL